LLGYTNFYIRFGLGRDFDRAHPSWQEYLAGLRDADDGRDWTYRFYMKQPHGLASPPVIATFGCFSYSRLRDDRLRLHFENAQTDECSSLGSSRRSQRLADRVGAGWNADLAARATAAQRVADRGPPRRSVKGDCPGH